MAAGLAAMMVLSACSPVGVAIGAGASVGVAAAEERGVSGAASDTGVRLEINKLWWDEDFELYRRVGMQIYEGRVLVSGVVPSNDMRDRAIQLAWQPDSVRSVINEVEVGDDKGIDQVARDNWTNAQVRTRLLLDREVDAINYRTRTVNGTVYVLGIAQDTEELALVMNITSRTQGVEKVVSHVLVKSDPRRSL